MEEKIYVLTRQPDGDIIGAYKSFRFAKDVLDACVDLSKELITPSPYNLKDNKGERVYHFFFAHKSNGRLGEYRIEEVELGE